MLTTQGDFFGGLINNVTAGIDGGLNTAEQQIVNGLVNQLGIQELYSFYLMGVCSGLLSNDTSNGCTSYDEETSGMFHHSLKA
jgi:hypothetical protein